MQRLRSIWGLRVLVVILMTGLMPALLGPSARAAQSSSAEAYADWLRDYLISPSDPVVARALDAAASSKAQTFDGFLQVFIQSFEAHQPEVVLAEVFSVEAKSTDGLVRLLYGEYQHVLGGVAAAHATISATTSGPAGITDRALAVLPDSGSDGAALFRPFHTLSFPSDPVVITPVQAYWAAFPQGP